MMRLEEYIVSSDGINAIIQFSKLSTVIFIVAHWIACFFWTIGKNELEKSEDCWIRRANIQDAELFDQYITALYWSFTTMTTVGYGDTFPVTPSERGYSIFCIFIACGVFAYVIGSIGEMVTRYNEVAAIFKEKMTYVNRFLIQKKISKDLRMKIRRYMEFLFDQKKKIKIDEAEAM